MYIYIYIWQRPIDMCHACPSSYRPSGGLRPPLAFRMLTLEVTGSQGKARLGEEGAWVNGGGG